MNNSDRLRESYGADAPEVHYFNILEESRAGKVARQRLFTTKSVVAIDSGFQLAVILRESGRLEESQTTARPYEWAKYSGKGI